MARCQAADGFDYATVRGEMRQDGSSLESAIKSLENHGEDESDFDLGSGGGADDSTSIRSLDSLESPSGISSRRRRPTRPLSLAESTRSGPTCDESSPRSLDVAVSLLSLPLSSRCGPDTNHPGIDDTVYRQIRGQAAAASRRMLIGGRRNASRLTIRSVRSSMPRPRHHWMISLQPLRVRECIRLAKNL